MTSPTPFHLVLGAGQVGDKVARLLAERGLRVRLARRSPAAPAAGPIERVQLDVTNADAVARAAEGAAAVYHCVNPLYHRWPAELLPLTRGIAEGTARAKSPLVVLDNLYMYGDTARMHEGLPPAPRSRKGRLRVEAAALLMESAARSGQRLAIGRAADFFGPETPTTGAFGDRFFRRVLAGQPAEFLGDADQPHTYSYTPDVARALVELGLRDSARGLYMLPAQPAESTRAVIARFARAAGRPIALTPLRDWVLSAAGLFVPLLREVREMTYQWHQPFVVDDAKIRAELGLLPTPWDEAIAATWAWAERSFAPAAERAAG